MTAIDAADAAIAAPAARLREVKRAPKTSWPRRIVEVSGARPDPRSDPNATQKISRELLEDALRRTKSGTRPRVVSEIELEEGLSGPRDDSPDIAPEITIVRIDSVEIETLAPASSPRPGADTASGPLTAMTSQGIATPLPSSSLLPSPRPSTPSSPHPIPRASAHAALSPGARRGRLRTLGYGLPLTPRAAFLIGIAVALVVALAAVVGFFAGRGVAGPR